MFRFPWIKLIEIKEHYPIAILQEDYYVFRCKDIKKQEYCSYYWKLVDYENSVWEYKHNFSYMEEKKEPHIKWLLKEIQTNMKEILNKEAKKLKRNMEFNKEYGFVEDIRYLYTAKEFGFMVCEAKFHVLEDWETICFRKEKKWVTFGYSLGTEQRYYLRFLVRQQKNGRESWKQEMLSHPNIRLHLTLH